MAIRTYDDTLEALAEKTDISRLIVEQANKQRRNQVVDLYGVEMHRQCWHIPEEYQDFGYNYIAQFYISIPPDTAYLERFGFKLWFEYNNAPYDPESPVIYPNNTRVFYGGTEITPFLALQQYGEVRDDLVLGTGIYPDFSSEANYDILTACSDMMLVGLEEEAQKILAPGFEVVTIACEYEFVGNLLLYLKYSHLNR